MNDKRLIDANALANTFLQLHVETDPLDNDWFTPYLMVKDSETVDAVEVVRCRDCKKYCNRGSKLGIHWCDKWGNVVRDMDFCSFGERKMD